MLYLNKIHELLVLNCSPIFFFFNHTILICSNIRNLEVLFVDVKNMQSKYLQKHTITNLLILCMLFTHTSYTQNVNLCSSDLIEMGNCFSCIYDRYDACFLSEYHFGIKKRRAKISQ